jgi:hypothetical protein
VHGVAHPADHAPGLRPGGGLETGCAAARVRVDPALAGSADEWTVAGDNPRRSDAPLSVGPYRSGASTWTLSLRATGAAQPAYAGELHEEGGLSFAVRSVHALDGSPVPLGSPAGYEVARDGAKVALVEVLGPGRVLVVRSSADGGVLASAAAALRLFRPPGDS